MVVEEGYLQGEGWKGEVKGEEWARLESRVLLTGVCLCCICEKRKSLPRVPTLRRQILAKIGAYVFAPIQN